MNASRRPADLLTDLQRAVGKLRFLAALALCLYAVGVAPGGADNGTDDAAALEQELLSEPGETTVAAGGGAELLLFERMPVVVTEAFTASRQVVKSRWLSAPVSVLTAQDIHYSGLTRIPEMLRFVPGMDVRRNGRNECAVGVRGLHDALTDRRLMLIDGRAADDPGSGGGITLLHPLMTEDIQRIEVLRGPGGGVWGANAFTGAINIITKDPRDQLGGMASVRVSHFGDWYTYLRYGEESGDWRYRVSGGFERLVDSKDANAGDFSPHPDMALFFNPAGTHPTDEYEAWRFSGKAIWEPTARRKLTVGIGHTHAHAGDTEVAATYLAEDGWIETSRLYARLDGTPDAQHSWYLQWFGNHYLRDWPSAGGIRTLQNDLEFQAMFAPVEAHRTTIGANVRWDHINHERDNDNVARFPLEPLNEYSAGAYVVHRWEPTDRLAFEGQARVDWFSETSVDWSGRVAMLYALDEAGKHIIRLAGAKSFRQPPTFTRELTLNGPLIFRVIKPLDELRNEQTWAIELGYRGELAEGLNLNVDAYVQRFEELVGKVRGPQLFTYIYDNVDGADTWGAEAELAYTTDDFQFSAWYAYNAFQSDSSAQSITAAPPERHKAGLTGRVFLPDGWTFNVQYRFQDAIEDLAASVQDKDKLHWLNLTLSKKFCGGNAELMFGVSDVLADERDGSATLGHISMLETPGRTFFMRLDVGF
ncbi:MAG: TonB-dependent receptor [Phycisphaerae bacterium]|nr:TonB-dependent receptor [Phycisphaerae bacterium]